MNTPIISSTGHPLFQIRAETPRLRRSLSRVLWHRFLTWMEKATPHAMFSLLTKLLTVAVIGLVVMAPQFLLGVLTDAATWNGYRIPAFLTLLAVTLYGRQAVRWVRRRRLAARGENQHTFAGVPVGELAAFLKRTGGWKRDEAIEEFAISQGQYHRVAEALKKHAILYHGDKNAHVLRDIGLSMLVTQLRELGRGKVPPLVWDTTREIWVERDGTFALHILDQEFRRRKVSDQTERAERKLEKMKEQIAEAREESVFERIASFSA